MELRRKGEKGTGGRGNARGEWNMFDRERDGSRGQVRMETRKEKGTGVGGEDRTDEIRNKRLGGDR